MSLNYFAEKIKGAEREIYLTLLISAVGLLGFGLGRLSRLEERKTPLVIRQEAALQAGGGPIAASSASAGNYVASKTGSAYYLPWCPGAGRIKDANKVWFETEGAAKQAGYKPAANCKGL